MARDYDLAPGFQERLRAVLASTERSANFANARAVRRLFDRVVACQEARLDPAGAPTEALRLLLSSDIPDPTHLPRPTPWGGYL